MAIKRWLKSNKERDSQTASQQLRRRKQRKGERAEGGIGQGKEVGDFAAFSPFPPLSAFGSGFGSGGFGAIKIITFLKEIKRKFRKPTVFGTFVVAGEGFEPTTSGL